jgi:HEAT repeat protein
MRWIAIGFLAAFGTLPVAFAAETRPEVAADEKLFTDASLKHDGPALLDFFRKRTGKDDDLERIDKLIPKLGDEDFETRRQALDELKKMSPPEAIGGAVRRWAATHADEEVRDQCRWLSKRAEKASPSRLACAAARLLRERKPDGAAGVLLAYLPFAQDDGVEEEALASLILLGAKDGKLDSAIGPALKDRLAARRATAAMLAGRSGSADEKKAVTALLGDKDTLIRLRAAQGLVASRDKEAVQTLISLLSDGTLDQATQAEDLLVCMAAGRGPRMPLGDSNATRKKCQDAWAAWWKTTEARFDLAKAEADLSPFNSTLRLRETIRRFLVAVNRSDIATVSRLCEPPFQLQGVQVMNSREETDNYWAGIVVWMRQQTVTVGAGSLVGIDEYVRTAPQEKDALSKLAHKNEVRVLYVNTYLNGQYMPQNAQFHALLFRVDGANARVIGVGQGTKQP